jgi:hypothetical protein
VESRQVAVHVACVAVRSGGEKRKDASGRSGSDVSRVPRATKLQRARGPLCSVRRCCFCAGEIVDAGSGVGR